MTRACTVLVALALTVGLAGGAAAQERDRDRGPDDRRDRRGVEERRPDDRGILERILGERQPRRDHRGRRGPAFCRSGAGHPVWGRRWCRDKGFALGPVGRGLGRLDRRGGGVFRTLPEILLGPDLHGDARFLHRGGALGRGDLGEILGLAVRDLVLHEVLSLSRHEARRVTGRWHDARRHGRRGSAYWQAGYRSPAYAEGLALQLFLGGERVAELVDLDRDGRVDLLLTGRQALRRR